jgi:predicted amidohydrolase
VAREIGGMSSSVTIALANLPYPADLTDAVERARRAIADAGRAGAAVLCFPESYVPGYRGLGHAPPPFEQEATARAWQSIAWAARDAQVAVVLGTERMIPAGLVISTLVIDRDGSTLGWQDKVQLDPSEEGPFVAGVGRALFRVDGLTFGVAICHEGWRYPETVRWAARRGAQLVFIPHIHEAEAGSHRPSTFAEAENSFHEKALLCRAAENTIFVAAANYASPGSPTTSAVVRPDGSVQAYQPYGVEGLLVAELDLTSATGLLASRYRPLEL